MMIAPFVLIPSVGMHAQSIRRTLTKSELASLRRADSTLSSLLLGPSDSVQQRIRLAKSQLSTFDASLTGARKSRLTMVSIRIESLLSKLETAETDHRPRLPPAVGVTLSAAHLPVAIPPSDTIGCDDPGAVTTDSLRISIRIEHAIARALFPACDELRMAHKRMRDAAKQRDTTVTVTVQLDKDSTIQVVRRTREPVRSQTDMCHRDSTTYAGNTGYISRVVSAKSVAQIAKLCRSIQRLSFPQHNDAVMVTLSPVAAPPESQTRTTQIIDQLRLELFNWVVYEFHEWTQTIESHREASGVVSIGVDSRARPTGMLLLPADQAVLLLGYKNRARRDPCSIVLGAGPPAETFTRVLLSATLDLPLNGEPLGAGVMLASNGAGPWRLSIAADSRRVVTAMIGRNIRWSTITR